MDCRIIGFTRSNAGRHSNVYMIRECQNCNALLEFPSNEVKTEVTDNYYREFIKCPHCSNEVNVILSKGDKF